MSQAVAERKESTWALTVVCKEDLKEKLWLHDRDQDNIERIALVHNTKMPYFDSWDDFIKNRNLVMKCNCLESRKPIYWSWTILDDEAKCPMTGREWEKFREEVKAVHTLHLVYLTWGHEVARISVRVTPEDEQAVREWIQSPVTEK